MTTAAELRQRQNLGRLNTERAARKAATATIVYKRTTPAAHSGSLGLTVSMDGKPLIARGGHGGVVPSDWEQMLLEIVAEQKSVIRHLRKEIAWLRAALRNG